MLHRTLEGLRNKLVQRFFMDFPECIKIANCTSNCTNQLDFAFQEDQLQFQLNSMGQKGHKGQNACIPVNSRAAGFTYSGRV